ncbi:hypothetical protein [Arthrobacter pigmenti]
MKSVISYTNERTADSHPAVRGAVQFAVGAVAATLIALSLLLVNFGGASAASASDGCYYAKPCGAQPNDGWPPPNPEVASTIVQCGGSTGIGALFAGWAGAGAGVAQCAWSQIW